MDAAEFAKTVANYFEGHLRLAARDFANGTLTAFVPCSFPTVLRVSETPHHLIGELCGASSPKKPAQVNIARPNSSEKFDGVPRSDPVSRTYTRWLAKPIAAIQDVFLRCEWASAAASCRWCRRSNRRFAATVTPRTRIGIATIALRSAAALLLSPCAANNNARL
jgi:hypothetical protein